jgi:hypothetical protein
VSTSPVRDLSVSYAEKIHTSLREHSRGINRWAIVEMLLSLSLILLAIGIVSADQAVSILGIKLTVPSWLLLTSGGAVVGMLLVYILKMTQYETLMQGHLDRLYGNLGFRDSSLREELPYGLQYPSVVNVFSTRRRNQHKLSTFASIFQNLLLGLLLYLMPVAAQVTAAVTSFKLLDGKWWIVIVNMLLIGISISALLDEVGFTLDTVAEEAASRSPRRRRE